MADPLSVTASIFAILGAFQQAKNGLNKLRSTFTSGGEVEALINEVSDLELVLRMLRDASYSVNEQSYLSTSLASQGLKELLDRANRKLLQLNELLQYQLLDVQDHPGQLRVRRVAWSRKRGEIMRIQDELKSIRTNILTSLEVINLLASPTKHEMLKYMELT